MNGTDIIRVNRTDNPKRANTAAFHKFAILAVFNGETLDSYLAACKRLNAGKKKYGELVAQNKPHAQAFKEAFGEEPLVKDKKLTENDVLKGTTSGIGKGEVKWCMTQRKGQEKSYITLETPKGTQKVAEVVPQQKPAPASNANANPAPKTPAAKPQKRA